MKEEKKWQVKIQVELQKAERARVAREKLLSTRVAVAAVDGLKRDRCTAVRTAMVALGRDLIAHLPGVENLAIATNVQAAAMRTCNEMPGGSK